VFPTLPGVALAPITAILLGLKKYDMSLFVIFSVKIYCSLKIDITFYFFHSIKIFYILVILNIL
ncbi:MAG: hypothetical protein ACTSVV_19465, partial [Promethearchaeota archaeon]